MLTAGRSELRDLAGGAFTMQRKGRLKGDEQRFIGAKISQER